MAQLPKPEKPLKILTIDGGGLQGISTLLILDKLLDAIARHNNAPDRKPRPCDVFDVIAGIGSGGWLALLLGRFQMDISSALAEWYNLLDCITPQSRTEALRRRVLEHSYYDTDSLVERIDDMADEYETGKYMFLRPPSGTACRHVFVSAFQTDSKGAQLGYHLFRTYQCPAGSKILPGPPDPRQYRISHAFGATGAARCFTSPWKETWAGKGTMKFLDTRFPSPHNISELALNEMRGLYGAYVEISVVVNIGPGIPNATDYKSITSRLSRRAKFSTADPVKLPSNQRPITGQIKARGSQSYGHDQDGEPSKNGPHVPHPARFDPENPATVADPGMREPHACHTSFRSESSGAIEDKLRGDEKEVEDYIKERLGNVCGKESPPYYRLAPDESAVGTVLNDTKAPKMVFNSTMQYLQIPRVVTDMDEIAQRIQIEIPVQRP
ncbi:MAG: hypothetical protein Q9195_009003 [Heterodermia aff. obscurata]